MQEQSSHAGRAARVAVGLACLASVLAACSSSSSDPGLRFARRV